MYRLVLISLVLGIVSFYLSLRLYWLEAFFLAAIGLILGITGYYHVATNTTAPIADLYTDMTWIALLANGIGVLLAIGASMWIKALAKRERLP